MQGAPKALVLLLLTQCHHLTSRFCSCVLARVPVGCVCVCVCVFVCVCVCVCVTSRFCSCVLVRAREGACRGRDMTTRYYAPSWEVSFVNTRRNNSCSNTKEELLMWSWVMGWWDMVRRLLARAVEDECAGTSKRVVMKCGRKKRSDNDVCVVVSCRNSLRLSLRLDWPAVTVAVTCSQASHHHVRTPPC
jgi:hypothetical protein